jgi:hypothetical protein
MGTIGNQREANPIQLYLAMLPKSHSTLSTPKRESEQQNTTVTNRHPYPALEVAM